MESRCFLRVKFHGNIPEQSIQLKQGLTYEAVIFHCMQQIKDVICDGTMEEIRKGPMYIPAFGLRLTRHANSPENEVWLPHWHKFDNSIDSTDDRREEKRTFMFRVRHRPLGAYDPNSILGAYLFLQMRDDFLLDQTFPIFKIPEEERLYLLVISLYTPKDMPLNNKDVIDNNFKAKMRKIDYRHLVPISLNKQLSKPIQKAYKLNSLEERFWFLKGMMANRRLLTSKSHMTVGSLKVELYDTLVKFVPDYCYEVYQAELSDGTVVSAILRLYHDSAEKNGLYYDEHLECQMRDIEEMSLLRPQNMNSKIWTILVRVPAGPPKALKFISEEEAVSFLSMCQGLVKLCVRWDLLLNFEKDLLITPSAHTTQRLKSFGPLYYEAAKDHLIHLSKNEISPDAGFLIHQSMTQVDAYVVVSYRRPTLTTNHSTMLPCNSQQDVDDLDTELQFKQQEIIWRSSSDCPAFTLQDIAASTSEDNCTVQEFWTETELLHHLSQPHQMQAQPVHYSKKADITEEFKRDIDPEDVSQALALRIDVDTDEKMPSVFLPKDFTREEEILDKNIKSRKYRVWDGRRYMMKVQVDSKDEGVALAFREGLERLEVLHRFKPERFLQLYNMVMCPQLTMVFELADNDDLLTYICGHPTTLADKIYYMIQVVLCLKAMYECNSYHGNIRSRKFLVFQDGNGRVKLKMEYPGITAWLDNMPEDDHLNLERWVWLAPERQRNLELVTYGSECYATGTTLAEIIFRTDSFAEKIGVPGNEELKSFLQDHHLPSPLALKRKGEPVVGQTVGAVQNEDTLNISEGDNAARFRSNEHTDVKTSEAEQTEEVADLITEAEQLVQRLWDKVILPCWHNNPNLRPTPDSLHADLNSFYERAQGVQGGTEQVAKLNYEDLGMSDKPAPLSQGQLRELLGKINKDFVDFTPETLRQEGVLGKGHFGTVSKGIMECGNGQKRTVAIKQMQLKDNPEECEESFRKEILLASQLDNNYIVKVLAVGPWSRTRTDLSELVLITEYMNKGSLKDYLNEKGDDRSPTEKFNELKKLCGDVVKGMVYLSGKNIVHRDLAPRNVLLTLIPCLTTDILMAKVSDFGLARHTDGDYTFYRIKRQEEFPWPIWPPEILHGSLTGKVFTSLGDVWSFGILLWCVFSKGNVISEMSKGCGIRLNEHSQRESEAYKLLKRNWRLPRRTIPADLYSVMMKCWMLNPKERPNFVDLEHEFL